MERICSPNLPKGKVKKLLIGEKYSCLSPVLRKFDIETLLLSDIPEVDSRLSGHADLVAVTIGNNILLGGRAGEKIAPMLEQLGFFVQLVPIIGPIYPADAALNACVMGGCVIHNRNFSALKNETGFIHVKQGYAKCNICPVTENALITSDTGIAGICRNAGMDVLQIRPGYISLEGFDTGFIGGAAFKLSADTLAFVGSIESHPDHKKVLDFLTQYGIKHLDLMKGQLQDIGSAVLLTEEY